MSQQQDSIGAAQASLSVRTAISTAAQRTSVDFDYLMRQAAVESGFDPNAKAGTSSAQGLFQFTSQTWLTMVKKHGADHGLDWAANAISRGENGSYYVNQPQLRGAIMQLRNDPLAASNMAAELALENGNHLSTFLGRDPEQVDLYLAHFLGAQGAVRFLAAHQDNPNASAAPLFPQAASANRNIFYYANGNARSLDEIRNRFAAKLARQPGIAPTPAQPSYQFTMTPRVSLPRQSANMPPLPEPARVDNWPAMMAMEKMPGKLSLDFAVRSYRRLAANTAA